MSKQPRRNDPCPCGSGRKFKHCCHRTANVGQNSLSEDAAERARLLFARSSAQEHQRKRQQGLGKPIISTEFKGQRAVIVGNRLHWSPKWKTFHDFLFEYLAGVFGKEWGDEQLRELESERHPVVQWYTSVCQFQRENAVGEGDITAAPMIGVVAAYMNLAYNLYLLGHNVELQGRLIKRLKNTTQFLAAVYETYVAAAFIKAGFTLAMEDEDDPTTTHCEFSATYPPSGRAFSVEAKSRLPGRPTERVTNQLYAALRKRAANERVVFIEMNVPDDLGEGQGIEWMFDALSSARGKESTLTINRRPAPSAYVILTNHSHHHRLEETTYRTVVVGEGFKIPDFKFDSTFRDLRQARLAKEKHQEIFHLLESMRTHDEIPSTFDGENPEFASEQGALRLQIGESYIVPTDDGSELPGILIDACVIEPQRRAYGIYRLSDARQVIVETPLTPEEIAAYRKHPETFFGVHRESPKQFSSPLDLFDFLFATYRQTPKEKLLTLMGGRSQSAELVSKSQDELAILYCESMVEKEIRLGRFG